MVGTSRKTCNFIHFQPVAELGGATSEVKVPVLLHQTEALRKTFYIACVAGSIVSARLKFWRRSRDPKKGVGTRRLKYVLLAASPLKSHSTSTQYRPSATQATFYKAPSLMNKVRILLALLRKEILL